jgi:hypothetical protein
MKRRNSLIGVGTLLMAATTECVAKGQCCIACIEECKAVLG